MSLGEDLNTSADVRTNATPEQLSFGNLREHHLAAMSYYCRHVGVGNLCQLCNTSYMQYHRCLDITSVVHAVDREKWSASFATRRLMQAYSTRFVARRTLQSTDLSQHKRQYHEATEASSADNWSTTKLHCLMFQAVTSDR